MEAKMSESLAAVPAQQAPKLFTVATPRIGAPWPGQGGINAGLIRGEPGRPDYFLILPLDPVAAIKAIAFGGRGKHVDGADSELDGLANTQALAASDIDHPLAKWAAGLTIEGHGDLYIPARKELRLLHVNLAEHFETDEWYWSSSQCAGYADYAWAQIFNYGIQINLHKNNELRARAVRRLIIQ
jgi:hypothetical protein